MGAAAALIISVPHTLVFMLPVYAKLAEVKGEAIEEGQGA